MKAFALLCGLGMAVFSAGTASANSGYRIVVGPDGRFYIVRMVSPPVRPISPLTPRTYSPPQRRSAGTRTTRAYPPMPRPDVHLRPFSVYSAGQMQRLVDWIRNNPYWTPQRKASQIRWWREQNEWMKKRNDDHIRRTYSNPYQTR